MFYSELRAFIFICIIKLSLCINYKPTWESIDSRPLPEWYNNAKFGIFIHWGVFSVPAFGSEWFWKHWEGDKNEKYVKFVKDNYKPNWTYADFASDFTTEFFNPNEWIDLFINSGAKYIVFTSKHHEGYTNWRSNCSFNWNSYDIGPKKDLVQMIADAVKNRGNELKFGLYHSMYEWFNPLYLQDQKNAYKTKKFVKEKVLPGLYEIVNTYKPDIVWSDGDWDAGWDYWGSLEFLAWLYNDSPVAKQVVVNDRWGAGAMCKHGGVYTCSDHYNPGVIQKHRFENAMTIDKDSWGYREASLSDYYTFEELLKNLVMTVSSNGNLLLNVGPTKDGMILPIFKERLLQIGSWLKINGEAIFSSQPWKTANDSKADNVWFTSSKNSSIVYAILLKWPENNIISLASVSATSTTKMEMLGINEFNIIWKNIYTGVDILLPNISFITLPSNVAWVLKMYNVV